MGSFGRQLPGVNVVWRDEVRLKWNFWLENVFKWKGSRQTSCALMGWEVDWGNWNSGFQCHTDRHKAWSPTHTYTSADKCAWACPHRCFCALSHLCFLSRACAHLSSLIRAALFCAAEHCRFYSQTYLALVLFVLNYLWLCFLCWEHQPAGHKIENKTVFKWYRERRVRETTRGTSENEDKRIIMCCYVSQVITLIAQHNPVLEGCTGRLWEGVFARTSSPRSHLPDPLICSKQTDRAKLWSKPNLFKVSHVKSPGSCRVRRSGLQYRK